MAEQLAEALSAAIGGAFSKVALYPMDIVKNNLQAVAAGSPKKMTQATVAKELVKTYGVSGLYCGWYWAMMSGFMEKGIYFFAYAWLKTLWTTTTGSWNTVGELVIGYVAEWTHTPFVQPIDANLVMTQTDSVKDPLTGAAPKNRTNMQRINEVMKTKGIAGFYKGWGSYTLLACKPAIQYYTFNFCKAVIIARAAVPRPDGLLTALESFIVGLIGRAVATILTFPAQRANVMAKAGNSDSSKGLIGTLIQVYKQDGIGKLYSGMQPEITRGCLSAGLMMMVKERIGVLCYAMVVRNTA